MPNIQKNFDLSKITRFRVGGICDYFFKPDTKEELSEFLKNNELPITVIGAASNLLIRSGGIRGVVIKLGKGFSYQKIEDRGQKTIITGAGTPNIKLVNFCAKENLGGLEFLYNIPGTIGGALEMNAGAYGSWISNVLISAEVMDFKGNIHTLKLDDFGYEYRKHNLPEKYIFLSAKFKVYQDDNVKAKLEEYTKKRKETQPDGLTCGSTFKNPPDKSAWKLIDEAGCRGLRIGGAYMSDKHCNFLINDGTAIPEDIENLGKEVQKRVKEKTGVELEWEIKIIGDL